MRIEAVHGDITAEPADAIVNAANSSLLGGGGVDGAIHAAAGPELLEECRRLRRTVLADGLAAGDAVATRGGRLAAAWVIHVVGPTYGEHPDGGATLLASCHTRALAVADQLGAAAVAFPAISCGAYGWTPAEAAPIAVGAVRTYASSHPSSGIDLVRFVLFTDEALEAFSTACSAVE
jgi:O-acetyl-ADP-ribose deacetylase